MDVKCFLFCNNVYGINNCKQADYRWRCALSECPSRQRIPVTQNLLKYLCENPPMIFMTISPEFACGFPNHSIGNFLQDFQGFLQRFPGILSRAHRKFIQFFCGDSKITSRFSREFSREFSRNSFKIAPKIFAGLPWEFHTDFPGNSLFFFYFTSYTVLWEFIQEFSMHASRISQRFFFSIQLAVPPRVFWTVRRAFIQELPRFFPALFPRLSEISPVVPCKTSRSFRISPGISLRILQLQELLQLIHWNSSRI